VHGNSHDYTEHFSQFHGKAIALDGEDTHAPLPLLFLVHEYMVRGRNFYQPTPDVEVTRGWQEWIVNEGVVNEKDNRSFTLNREGPILGPLAGQSSNVQTAAQSASSSESQTAIKPPTADLIKELVAYQRTMPSWKACQREAVGWEGTA
jgi:hypothetical protein